MTIHTRLHRCSTRVALATAAWLFAAPVYAADYYVNATTGNDNGCCGSMAAPCRTLKATFARFSPAPALGSPAVVHVAPGVYSENAAPAAPQTGFSVPNHTHLISDQGADETVLQVDLSNLATAGIVYVVRGQQIGLGANATNITIDGFTITVPYREVDLQMHQVVGINLGAGLSTSIAPSGNVITNNVISLSNKDGRTSFSREGAGVFATGGVNIDCNVFRLIDSVGISMSSVESFAGVNNTAPAQITRNWFYQFTNTLNLDPVSDDEYIAVGINVATTVRGNLFDFSRRFIVDRRFGLVCWDCPNLVAQNNIFTGADSQSDAPVAFVSQTPGNGPFTPLFDHNTVTQGWDGIQGYDGDQQSLGGTNFRPTVTNNILWVSYAVRDLDAGTFDYNNWTGIDLPAGVSNISNDPLFQDLNTRDFRLATGSPSLTGGEAGIQQGAYGGATPFGSISNPTKACVLRGTAAGYPDLGQCVGQPIASVCGPPQCADATTSSQGGCFMELCDESVRTFTSCDDNNPNTPDRCVPGIGCVHTAIFDAGQPDSGQAMGCEEMDAGSIETDAGVEPDMDAGLITLPDGGVVLPDGGPVLAPTTDPLPAGTLVVGVCGCTSISAPMWALAVLALLALLRRRRWGR
jgi:MYXO-CTERM domain-containing protein